MPVRRLELSAKNEPALKGGVRLDWKADFEKGTTNDSYFIVQRSRDGKIFENIATVKVADKNANIDLSVLPQLYDYQYQETGLGEFYYRLAFMENNQATKYSNISNLHILQDAKAGSKDIILYPNPIREGESVHLSYMNKEGTSELGVNIVDPSGRQVFASRFKLAAGLNQIQFNPALDKGLYFIRLTEMADQTKASSLNSPKPTLKLMVK